MRTRGHIDNGQSDTSPAAVHCVLCTRFPTVACETLLSPCHGCPSPQVFVTADRFGFLRLKEEVEVLLMARALRQKTQPGRRSRRAFFNCVTQWRALLTPLQDVVGQCTDRESLELIGDVAERSKATRLVRCRTQAEQRVCVSRSQRSIRDGRSAELDGCSLFRSAQARLCADRLAARVGGSAADLQRLDGGSVAPPLVVAAVAVAVAS